MAGPTCRRAAPTAAPAQAACLPDGLPCEGSNPRAIPQRARSLLPCPGRRRGKAFSRRRAFNPNKDIDYINERNAHFNKKIERAFGTHTAEIKANLERGALPALAWGPVLAARRCHALVCVRRVPRPGSTKPVPPACRLASPAPWQSTHAASLGCPALSGRAPHPAAWHGSVPALAQRRLIQLQVAVLPGGCTNTGWPRCCRYRAARPSIDGCHTAAAWCQVGAAACLQCCLGWQAAERCIGAASPAANAPPSLLKTASGRVLTTLAPVGGWYHEKRFTNSHGGEHTTPRRGGRSTSCRAAPAVAAPERPAPHGVMPMQCPWLPIRLHPPDAALTAPPLPSPCLCIYGQVLASAFGL